MPGRVSCAGWGEDWAKFHFNRPPGEPLARHPATESVEDGACNVTTAMRGFGVNSPGNIHAAVCSMPCSMMDSFMTQRQRPGYLACSIAV